MSEILRTDESGVVKRISWRPDAPINFPDWKLTLFGSSLPAPVKTTHFRAILGFLAFCKRQRCPATVIAAQRFQDEAGVQGQRAEFAPGLRWFFIEGRRKSVETTQIYLHVMRKPGVGVISPLDNIE